MTDRFERAVDAVTGAGPTTGVIVGGGMSLALDPGPIIQWGTAAIVVLTALTWALKLYREFLGAKIDREKLEDARDA